jgi:serine/threonine protein kinase
MRRYSNTLLGHLKERNELEEKLTAREVVSICLEIIVGLGMLHRNLILHRDLKTENIFITLDGMRNLQTCAIGDMDRAKQLKSKSVFWFFFIVFFFFFWFFFIILYYFGIFLYFFVFFLYFYIFLYFFCISFVFLVFLVRIFYFCFISFKFMFFTHNFSSLIFL